jgi:hypothetical protein
MAINGSATGSVRLRIAADLFRVTRNDPTIPEERVPAEPLVFTRAPLEQTYNVASDEGLGPVYNEEAFRYFLQIERKRSNRSNRRFLLLLVDLKKQAGLSDEFDSAAAGTLFAAMCPCLRETDFVGWYRQGRVASAVLTQLGEMSGIEVSRMLAERVGEALRGRFSHAEADRLQIRVYQVPSMNGQS